MARANGTPLCEITETDNITSISRLLWYYNRLRGMTAREISHRIVEQARYRSPLDVSRPANWRNDEVAIDATCRILTSNVPGARTEVLRSRADAVEKLQKADIFESSWSLNSVNWAFDQDAGFQWPSVRPDKISYRHGSGADPKRVWELNRLQFLLPLARLRLVDDADHHRTIVGTIQSWLSQNTDGNGIAWASAIEPAVRLITFSLLRAAIDDEAIPASFDAELSATVGAHAAWLRRFPSEYSSANNHRVAEIVALLFAEPLWTGIVSADYAAELERELLDVVRNLILEDGAGAEQSPTYAAFVLELATLLLVQRKWLDVKVAVALRDRVGLGLAFLRTVTTVTGGFLRFGDDDEGWIYSSLYEPASLTATVAGVSGLDQPAALGGVATFPHGGCTVMRFIESNAETQWLIDHGPLGFGAIAAHGHADALSVIMVHDGVEWLGDPGTFRYHGEKEDRNYFRHTAVHNTPTVGGRNSSQITGDFNWSNERRAQAVLNRLIVEGDAVELSAHHDGYAFVGVPVLHRTFVRHGENEYSVRDKYYGDEVDYFESTLLLHPTTSVMEDESSWTLTNDASDSRVLIRVHDQTSVTVGVRTAFYSPRYGKRTKTRQLWIRAQPGTSEILMHIQIVDNKLGVQNP